MKAMGPATHGADHGAPETPATSALFCCALGLLVFFVLVVQLDDYGVTWDEIEFKFPSAWRLAEWIATLGPSSFSRDRIAQAFATGSQHPSLHRTVMAVSWLVLHRGLGVPELIAFRIPQAVYFSVLVAVVAWVMARRAGRVAAIIAAGSLLAMPHVWGLAHIACLDTVVAVAWLAVVLLFAGASERAGWRSALLIGLAYGLALCTKLHAIFVPIPLVIYALLHPVREPRRVAVCTLLLAPLLYVVLQPWTWYAPCSTIGTQIWRYVAKEEFAPIPVYYLGQVFTHRPSWHYVPVMFVTTVPVTLLVFVLIGLVRALHRWRTDPFGLLLALNLLTALGIFLLPAAGVYDGVRLFLPAFYFGACLAGLAVRDVVCWLAQRSRECRQALSRAAHPAVGTGLLVAACLVPGWIADVHLHPAELSYANALVGGLAGARRLGLQTTYWGEVVTRDVLNEVNRFAPPSARLKTMALPEDALPYYQRQGWLREDVIVNGPPPYDLHLVQFRQSFFGPMAWWMTETQTPLWVWQIDGVPLVALYGALPARDPE